MTSETPAERAVSLVARRPILTLAVAVLGGAGLTTLLQSLPPKGQALTLTPVVKNILNDAGSPRIGPEAAEVTVVVFTDYQCPICKRTDGALERSAAADPGLRVIYKDWPILGAASTLAARAALAAARQGQYLALHRGLMANRTKLDAEQIRRIAVEARLDWPRLVADQEIHAAAIETQLGRHAIQALSLGLEGTPGYLVGAQLLKGGLSDRDLARAVAAARKAGPPR
jgi:protein-disulfide isomerase